MIVLSRSSVTPRAIGRRIQLQLILQIISEHGLISARNPLEVRDLTRRAEVRRRIAVAVEAPAHREWFLLHDDVFLRNIAVTGEARHSGSQVSGVVEVGVIGNFMDTNPLHWLAGCDRFTDRQQFGALFEDDVVAVHTGRGGRNVGMSRLFDHAVAVAAIHPEVASVQLMAERDRLGGTVADFSVFR